MSKLDQSQNELGATFRLKADLSGRELEIMKIAEHELGFFFASNKKPEKSTWWNSDRVGAMRWRGSFSGQPALLKVQGVKPSTSEIVALTNFEKLNHSQFVRPPRLLASRPWDDALKLELIAIELIESDKLISYPTTQDEVAEFFQIFKDYRDHSIGNPWVKRPIDSLAGSTRKRVEEDLNMGASLFPNHPLRHPEDFQLIENGLSILDLHYREIEPEFQHCHISTDDVFKPNANDPRYLYTSNFMWGWEAPYFDATYAYLHYNRLLADRYKGADRALLASQAQLWKDALYMLTSNESEKTLLNLALLKKAISCLAISDLALENSNQLIAQDLIDLSRSNTHELIAKLT